MLFENNDPEYLISIRGTCFIISSGNRLYGVTAKHNTEDFHPRQYRIPACFGSHNMLPFSQPFTVEMQQEDFEDFVLIPIEESAKELVDFDSTCASDLDITGIAWSNINRVIVAGFPTELNEPDYENGSLSYQPVLLTAVIISKPDEDGIGTINVCDVGKLKSLEGFSGSPVYVVSRLVGNVLRGSRDTSISQLLHFLDVRIFEAIINHDIQEKSELSGSPNPLLPSASGDG